MYPALSVPSLRANWLANPLAGWLCLSKVVVTVIHTRETFGGVKRDFSYCVSTPGSCHFTNIHTSLAFISRIFCLFDLFPKVIFQLLCLSHLMVCIPFCDMIASGHAPSQTAACIPFIHGIFTPFLVLTAVHLSRPFCHEQASSLGP